MEIIFNIFHVEYNTSTRNIDVYGCVRYAIKLIGVEWEISYLKKQSMLYDLQYAPVWILEYLRLKIETLQQSKQDEKRRDSSLHKTQPRRMVKDYLG